MTRMALLSSAAWVLPPLHVVGIEHHARRQDGATVTTATIRHPVHTVVAFERELLMHGKASIYIPPRPHPKRSA